MIRSLLIALLLVCGAHAQAQIISDGMGGVYGGAKASSSGYAGIGDVLSGATAYWGLRAYNAAYATGSNNAINVRRAANNATSNIVILTSGALDVSTAASFAGTDATASCSTTGLSTTMACTGASSTPNVGDQVYCTGCTNPTWLTAVGTFAAGAGSVTLSTAQTISVAVSTTFQVGLFVVTAYDQSGHGYTIGQGTAAYQPQLLFQCRGSLPCMSFDYAASASSGQNLYTTGFIALSQPFSFLAVAERTGRNTSIGDVLNSSQDFGFFNAANTLWTYAGGAAYINVTLTDGTWGAMVGIPNGASGQMQVNGGGVTTASGGTGGTNASLLALGTNGTVPTGYYVTGYITEAGVYPVSVASSAASIITNQRSYWGF